MKSQIRMFKRWAKWEQRASPKVISTRSMEAVVISSLLEKIIKGIHLKYPNKVRFLEIFRCQLLLEGSLKLWGKLRFKDKEEEVKEILNFLLRRTFTDYSRKVRIPFIQKISITSKIANHSFRSIILNPSWKTIARIHKLKKISLQSQLLHCLRIMTLARAAKVN